MVTFSSISSGVVYLKISFYICYFSARRLAWVNKEGLLLLKKTYPDPFLNGLWGGAKGDGFGLRAYLALVGDLGLVPNTQAASYNYLELKFRQSDVFLIQRNLECMWCTYAQTLINMK